MFIALFLAAAAPSVPITHAALDVPDGQIAQQVIVQERAFPSGSESGWHTHPGTEVAVMVSGTMELMTKGGVRRVSAGESFTIPRGMPHNARNGESDTAKLVLTLVVDKGAAPRQPVPAPD